MPQAVLPTPWRSRMPHWHGRDDAGIRCLLCLIHGKRGSPRVYQYRCTLDDHISRDHLFLWSNCSLPACKISKPSRERLVSHYAHTHLAELRRGCDASGTPHPKRLVTPHEERLRHAALLFMREQTRRSDLSHSHSETWNRMDIMNPKESSATEHTEEKKVLQLAELLTHRSLIDTMPRPPAPAQIELKVIQSAIMDYTYKWQGKEVHTQKLQTVLQSKIEEEYCLGVAKLQRKDRTELKQMADRWQTGSTWRFKGLTLHSDKPASIHTPCCLAIDLRKTKAEKLLQSTSYPPTPVPTVTIADEGG